MASKDRIELVIALVTALVAAGGLTYELHAGRGVAIQREARDWQRSIVYQILEQSPQPLSATSVLNEYRSKIEDPQYRAVVPSEMTLLGITRVLLSLRQEHAVGRDSKGTYYVTGDSESAGLADKGGSTPPEQQRLDGMVLDKVMAHSGEFSVSDLYEDFRRSRGISLTAEQFSAVVDSLIERQRVFMTSDRKLYAKYPEQAQ